MRSFAEERQRPAVKSNPPSPSRAHVRRTQSPRIVDIRRILKYNRQQCRPACPRHGPIENHPGAGEITRGVGPAPGRKKMMSRSSIVMCTQNQCGYPTARAIRPLVVAIVAPHIKMADRNHYLVLLDWTDVPLRAR